MFKEATLEEMKNRFYTESRIRKIPNVGKPEQPFILYGVDKKKYSDDSKCVLGVRAAAILVEPYPLTVNEKALSKDELYVPLDSEIDKSMVSHFKGSKYESRLKNVVTMDGTQYHKYSVLKVSTGYKIVSFIKDYGELSFNFPSSKGSHFLGFFAGVGQDLIKVMLDKSNLIYLPSLLNSTEPFNGTSTFSRLDKELSSVLHYACLRELLRKHFPFKEGDFKYPSTYFTESVYRKISRGLGSLPSFMKALKSLVFVLDKEASYTFYALGDDDDEYKRADVIFNNTFFAYICESLYTVLDYYDFYGRKNIFNDFIYSELGLDKECFKLVRDCFEEMFGEDGADLIDHLSVIFEGDLHPGEYLNEYGILHRLVESYSKNAPTIDRLP